MLADPKLAKLIEADLRSEYGVSLVSFYRREISVREMCVLVFGLRHDSRFYMAIRDVELTVQEDLLWDIRDLCAMAAYYSSAGGLKGLEPRHQRELMKEAPKPNRKPGVQPEKPKFLNARELKQVFGRKK